ncbi:MAG: COG4315 family predicted lipoprotein [Streptosporangiaceae bacterium]
MTTEYTQAVPERTFNAPAGAGRRLRRAALAGLAGAAAAIALVACGGGGSPGGAGSTGGHAAANTAVVTIRHLAGLGTVLVSASGKTIYSPEQEARGQIQCTGGCLSFWFPVTVTSTTGLHAPSGLTGVLGTIHRHDDGRTQLTYNGRPLYTFRLDQSPGQARGSNFTDSFGGTSFTWQAVTASGAASGSGGGSAPTGGAAPTGGPGYQGGSGY